MHWLTLHVIIMPNPLIFTQKVVILVSRLLYELSVHCAFMKSKFPRFPFRVKRIPSSWSYKDLKWRLVQILHGATESCSVLNKILFQYWKQPQGYGHHVKKLKIRWLNFLIDLHFLCDKRVYFGALEKVCYFAHDLHSTGAKFNT